jgi:hypothetical protein
LRAALLLCEWEDVVGSAFDQLLRAGNVTIADAEIKESGAPAMGLEQLPSDY